MSILFSRKIKKIFKNLKNTEKSSNIRCLIKNKNGLKSIVKSQFFNIFQEKFEFLNKKCYNYIDIKNKKCYNFITNI